MKSNGDISVFISVLIGPDSLRISLYFRCNLNFITHIRKLGRHILKNINCIYYLADIALNLIWLGLLVLD